MGTTFKVYLPAVSSPLAAPLARIPAEPAAGGSETILLVEDEVPLRLLAQQILLQRGYTVLVAESPRYALQLAATHPRHGILHETVNFLPKPFSPTSLAQKVRTSLVPA